MLYRKILFGKLSGHSNYIYKINQINVDLKWNIYAKRPELMGGFSFLKEEEAFNYLYRGDTLYEVIIPLDAEIVNFGQEKEFANWYRTNKIILQNPQKITDDVALKLYKKYKNSNTYNIDNIMNLIKRNFINTMELWMNENLSKGRGEEILKNLNNLEIQNECIDMVRDWILNNES